MADECVFHLPSSIRILAPCGCRHKTTRTPSVQTNAKVGEVLFSKDSVGHERDVEAAFQRISASGGTRLARPDIALQQPSHGMRAAHVRADFAEHFCLRACELEPSWRETV